MLTVVYNHVMKGKIELIAQYLFELIKRTSTIKTNYFLFISLFEQDRILSNYIHTRSEGKWKYLLISENYSFSQQ